MNEKKLSENRRFINFVFNGLSERLRCRPTASHSVPKERRSLDLRSLREFLSIRSEVISRMTTKKPIMTSRQSYHAFQNLLRRQRFHAQVVPRYERNVMPLPHPKPLSQFRHREQVLKLQLLEQNYDGQHRHVLHRQLQLPHNPKNVKK